MADYFSSYLGRPVAYSFPVTSTTAPTTTTGTGAGTTSGTSTPLPAPADAISTITGIDPNEVFNATMGKVIPIWVGGMPRMGCHIIYGPTTRIEGGVTLASFGVSFGMPANNIGNRELRELRLDGYQVWTLADGDLIDDLTFRFYPGNEFQAADPLVIAAFPLAPVAHKGQCTVFIEDLPLTNFANKVPFVSALIADTTDLMADPEDGINLGEGLAQVAASPYVNAAFVFEALDIGERVDAIIIAEKISFVDLLIRYSTLYLWDVIQQDKLRIIERGTVTPDISLSFSDIMAASGEEAPIVIERQQQEELPKELEYSYIDPDRDYEINTVRAIHPTSPTQTTVSSGTDTIALPSVHSVQEALTYVTLRHFKNENARDRLAFTVSISGFEIEPGDILSVDAGFKNYIVRVTETLHGADWTNRIVAEPVLRCAIPVSIAPLDGLSCVTGAWSLSRQLLSSWAGQFYSTLTESGGGWTPATLGPKFWYMGDSLVGADGSAVSTWEDQSGNNNDATAASTFEPQLETSELNGMNVVRAVRANSDMMTVSGTPMVGATAATVHMVLRVISNSAVNGAPLEIGGQFLTAEHYCFSDGSIYSNFCTGSRKTVGDPGDLTAWHITGITSTNNDWRFYFNGNLFFNTASNGFSLSAPILFRSEPGGATQYWDGYIAEIFVTDTVLSQSDREKAEGYLAHKWGLTSVLDSGHPYKSSPP